MDFTYVVIFRSVWMPEQVSCFALIIMKELWKTTANILTFWHYFMPFLVQSAGCTRLNPVPPVKDEQESVGGTVDRQV
jgi:hypothetical protein